MCDSHFHRETAINRAERKAYLQLVEVERILNMVDGVVLVVDATHGPGGFSLSLLLFHFGCDLIPF